MSRGGHQVNDVNGDNLIALVSGRPLPRELVGLDQHPITPNQSVEAAVAQCWYYALVSPNAVRLKLAMAKLTLLLKQQQARGFMTCAGNTEFMAGSGHLSIWLRAMTGALLFADRAQKAGVEIGELPELLAWWWRSLYAVAQLGMVPSGPLAGRVVLPGARKPKGEEAGNAVLSGVLQIAAGGKLATKGLNTKALVLDPSKPDLAAIAFAAMVKKGLGFGDLASGVNPKLAAPLVVERGNFGHVAYFPEGWPGVDVAPRVWVEYGTGRYSYGDDPAPFDHVDHVIRLSGVGE